MPCGSLKGQIPFTKYYGITPDISIIMMHTFYQSVYYASHNQSFPSTSEEKHAWVGFGKHVSDAITHKFLIPQDHLQICCSRHGQFISQQALTYQFRGVSGILQAETHHIC